MKYVIDIECNALERPDRIWLVVLKCIDTGEYLKFYDLTKREEERERFIRFIRTWHQDGHLLIGHNILGYDWPVLCTLLELDTSASLGDVIDTLVISKLVDYSRDGHSIEDYGKEFGLEKGKFSDFSKYSQEMEDYCVRDVDICHKIYSKYSRYINNPDHRSSIDLEQWFQLVVNNLHDNGFCFNATRARSLLQKVELELSILDKDILDAFPPRLKLIREIHPKVTSYGTLNRTDFRWVTDGDLSDYNGGPFCRCHWSTFNPSSHKQIIQVLNEAGWSPVDKTKTHIDAVRAKDKDKLKELQKTGWKVNETNLDTLPPGAPKPSRLLARRILLESRRRTLTEWLELVHTDGRIHGRFYGIGAWTHRMSHQNPNTANIPNEFDTAGKKKLLGKELRSLWCAPKGRLLVGCDAEGIQLRIFAHYINDKEFTDALVRGKKEDKTDPHSLNQRILGSVCKSRAAAKRFIYALLLGAGLGKLSEILDCSQIETEEALGRLMGRYEGWAILKSTVFPKDARRGYFVGLDGRKVRIPGDSDGTRRHLAMSGYLQCGEAVCMKMATRYFFSLLPQYDAKLVNFVHDEWQVECGKSLDKAVELGHIMADSLRKVGEDLKLNCPLAGSFYNDDLKDYTIGTNWSVTH
jgi:DNA polymerase-1